MKFFRKRQPRHRATQHHDRVMDWLTDPGLTGQQVQQRIDGLFRPGSGPVYLYTRRPGTVPVVVPAALIEVGS